MVIMILVLLGFSLFLLVISFFQKDSFKDLKEEVDHLTLQHVQEFYQVKQRLRILEEELLAGVDHFTSLSKSSGDINEIIKNQVMALARQGKTIEQIANQSSLTIEEVHSILKEFTEV